MAASKQSSSSAQSLGAGGKEKPSVEPSISEPPKDMAAGSSVVSATKDSVSVEADGLPKKDVSEAGSVTSATQSDDVVMVDAEQKTEKSNKENPTASQDVNAGSEKLKVSTGEQKQSLATSGKENSQDQTGKQPSVVIEENKGEGDEVEKTGSAPAEKEVDKSVDTGKVMDKMATDCNREKGPVVVNVEEHHSDARQILTRARLGKLMRKKAMMVRLLLAVMNTHLKFPCQQIKMTRVKLTKAKKMEGMQ